MITVSQSAKNKIREMLGKETRKNILLYVKGAGCNGFSYNFKILENDVKPNKLDEEYKIDDFSIYLCGKSIMYLIGVKVDYVNDIMESKFEFTNDNIQSKCGCGKSFAFKEN
jgi:iron-sulfur cluster assembly accessory protein